MILRKPYAFFIKYFKLLHAIIALFVGFLLYRSFKVYSFFNAYISDYNSAINNFSPRTLINMYSFFAILLITILAIILLSVMIYKKKPKSLYIYSLFVFIFVFILYAVTYPTLRDINAAVLDIRVSKGLRDFFLIAMIFQSVGFVLYVVRATGFDIKQFDFGSDLQKLNIDAKDSEEIEVSLEFDKNRFNRSLRYQIRQFRYLYGENRLIFNTLFFIVFVVIVFNVYMNMTVYSAKYDQGTSFEASGVALNVRNSYLTKLNSAGETLTDGKILVLKLDAKKLYGSNVSLNTGLVTVRIDGKSYSQDNDYAKELSDLGEAYVNQKLDKEYQSYILAFNIPTSEVNKKMTFKFNDNVSYVKGEVGAKNVYVDLNPIDLDKKTKVITNKIGDVQNYDDSVLESADLKIDSYEINNKFKYNYNYCYGVNKCMDSYEYIVPTATGNYFKTLMKINGEFNSDNNQIDDVISFMNTFGVVNYKINDIWKSVKINSSSFNSNFDGFYLEVPYDIKDASKISFTFNVRNLSYKYVLK